MNSHEEYLNSSKLTGKQILARLFALECKLDEIARSLPEEPFLMRRYYFPLTCKYLNNGLIKRILHKHLANCDTPDTQKMLLDLYITLIAEFQAKQMILAHADEFFTPRPDRITEHQEIYHYPHDVHKTLLWGASKGEVNQFIRPDAVILDRDLRFIENINALLLTPADEKALEDHKEIIQQFEFEEEVPDELPEYTSRKREVWAERCEDPSVTNQRIVQGVEIALMDIDVCTAASDRDWALKDKLQNFDITSRLLCVSRLSILVNRIVPTFSAHLMPLIRPLFPPEEFSERKPMKPDGASTAPPLSIASDESKSSGHDHIENKIDPHLEVEISSIVAAVKKLISQLESYVNDSKNKDNQLKKNAKNTINVLTNLLVTLEKQLKYNTPEQIRISVLSIMMIIKLHLLREKTLSDKRLRPSLSDKSEANQFLDMFEQACKMSLEQVRQFSQDGCRLVGGIQETRGYLVAALEVIMPKYEVIASIAAKVRPSMPS